jgi:deoxyribodipyrimidine photo-lyase
LPSLLPVFTLNEGKGVESMKKKVIVWLRRDLRTIDNPALYKAAEQGEVIPVYIHDPGYEGEWAPGAASRWWLHHALLDMQRSLQELGCSLLIRKGETKAILLSLLKETGAQSIYFNRRCEPVVMEKDHLLLSDFQESGLDIQTFEAHLMLPPWSITRAKNEPYKVFTAFYKAFQKEKIPFPYKRLTRVKGSSQALDHVSVNDLKLLPAIHWTGTLEQTWEISERGAWKQFKYFLRNGLARYKDERDFPVHSAHSSLSPYFAFGQISPRYLFHYLRQKAETCETAEARTQVEAFVRQLVWREFAWHLLFHFPHTAAAPLYEKFNHFEWEEDEIAFTAWTKGLTGYPLVDAGMRELWATGFMHNRVRMVAGSFLVKHLLMPWQKGAAWFWDTLVDADLGNNTLGWQWVAGSGADAAPYFRIFNPTAQGEKFDGDGEYIRKWVPELQQLPDKYIHKPQEAPQDVLTAASITLGITYPRPIVDHRAARERALERYNQLKSIQ